MNNQVEHESLSPQIYQFLMETINSVGTNRAKGNQSTQPGQVRIMALGQLNLETMSGDLGAPKKQRYHKETTIEMLLKIAIMEINYTECSE